MGRVLRPLPPLTPLAGSAMILVLTVRRGPVVIDEKLLAILACPVCHAPLRLDGESLVCAKTEVRFPIEDGIPNLLPESAEPPHPAQPSPEQAPPPE